MLWLKKNHSKRLIKKPKFLFHFFQLVCRWPEYEASMTFKSLIFSFSPLPKLVIGLTHQLSGDPLLSSGRNHGWPRWSSSLLVAAFVSCSVWGQGAASVGRWRQWYPVSNSLVSVKASGVRIHSSTMLQPLCLPESWDSLVLNVGPALQFLAWAPELAA